MEYRERLVVPLWWWPLVGFFALSFAIALFVYLPVVVGSTVAIGVLLFTAAALVAMGSVRIGVDEQALTAGHSRIEWAWIDRVRGCDAETMRTILHSSHQVGSFLVTRPWISSGVVVRLADPADPHPAWILSSRHPDELAAAIARHLDQERP
ncbi:DUF3093 domain-containing protein [Acidipropionibacterium timonense]|uniref:DUF3093 domain-containing protein n=1 Tax=Acidipropionibacterium timonense TaxID=2161818 RepID=UPI001FD8EE70|nr:DUF3093 domain-containing protein [Acidipropionibacterium timonense]